MKSSHPICPLHPHVSGLYIIMVWIIAWIVIPFQNMYCGVGAWNQCICYTWQSRSSNLVVLRVLSIMTNCMKLNKFWSHILVCFYDIDVCIKHTYKERVKHQEKLYAATMIRICNIHLKIGHYTSPNVTTIHFTSRVCYIWKNATNERRNATCAT